MRNKETREKEGTGQEEKEKVDGKETRNMVRRKR
jgi:hypothetical protein